jgi:hypothetical protein
LGGGGYQGNRMNSNRAKAEELLAAVIRGGRNQPAHLDAILAWYRIKANQI